MNISASVAICPAVHEQIMNLKATKSANRSNMNAFLPSYCVPATYAFCLLHKVSMSTTWTLHRATLAYLWVSPTVWAPCPGWFAHS